MWLDFDVRDNRRCTFSLEEALLWIMDLMLDLFHLLSSPDVNWWTGVVWIIVMFLSDSHSDGTHSLQSIHCWDTDAETHFYKSDEETNSSIYILSKFSAHFHFWLHYFFNLIRISISSFSKALVFFCIVVTFVCLTPLDACDGQSSLVVYCWNSAVCLTPFMCTQYTQKCLFSGGWWVKTHTHARTHACTHARTHAHTHTHTHTHPTVHLIFLTLQASKHNNFLLLLSKTTAIEY